MNCLKMSRLLVQPNRYLEPAWIPSHPYSALVHQQLTWLQWRKTRAIQLSFGCFFWGGCQRVRQKGSWEMLGPQQPSRHFFPSVVSPPLHRQRTRQPPGACTQLLIRGTFFSPNEVTCYNFLKPMSPPRSFFFVNSFFRLRNTTHIKL